MEFKDVVKERYSCKKYDSRQISDEQLAAIINALFAVLAILGIVTDPTTAGVGDSAQALTYTEPKRDE